MSLMKKSMERRSRKVAAASLLLIVWVFSSGTASAATTFVHTSLTIHRKPGGVIAPGTAVTISGKLNSGRVDCRSGQTIQLIKLGTGVVATTVTNAKGKYTFVPQTVNTDSAYQTSFGGAPGGVHPNTFVCGGSISRILKVKVKGNTAVLGTGGTNVQGGSSALTGGDLLPAFSLLAVLIVVGLSAIVVSRRRKRA
jgi:hypothetical protein